MYIDYSSLLIALAFSSFAILVAAVTSWSSARHDRYLFFSAIGVASVMIAMILMGLRNGRFEIDTLLVPFTLMHVGVGFIYAGTRLFLGKTDMMPAIAAASGTAAFTAISLITGMYGLSFIGLNLGIALELMLCAHAYANSNHELKSAVSANALLYFITSASFIAPVVPVALAGDLFTYPAMDTGLDTINAIVSLIGMTGIGALTLTLHFSRVAIQHQTDANTDPLTGVLNRRALFERFGGDGAIPGRAVLLFDLDFFKIINDQLGHAQGDRTLRQFGDLLQACFGTEAMVARIGGEEFCVVLPIEQTRRAREMAEDVRLGFAALCLPSGREDAMATVSVGLATGGLHESFDSVLSRADAALYKAKRSGRNKVKLAEGLMAA